jgi:hypothetical protein
MLLDLKELKTTDEKSNVSRSFAQVNKAPLLDKGGWQPLFG